MHRVSKQILAIGLPVAAVAVTGVAVAYWTTTGSGTGTAGTAASATTVTVRQASAPTGMGPGIAAGDITVTVSNPGSSSVPANQVLVTIDSVTKVAGAPAGTCTASDYVLTGATMTTGATTLAPSTSTTFSGATLQSKDDAIIDQDGCKGATVTLAYAAS